MAVGEWDVHAASTAPVLIDVRELDEWQLGHAPSAIHLPLSTFDAADVPAGGEVAVICRSGGRSARAAALLDGAGRGAVNVAGGMLAWQAEGLPVVTDSGEPGVVPA